jgi:hypothetical protein
MMKVYNFRKEICNTKKEIVICMSFNPFRSHVLLFRSRSRTVEYFGNMNLAKLKITNEIKYGPCSCIGVHLYAGGPVHMLKFICSLILCGLNSMELI